MQNNNQNKDHENNSTTEQLVAAHPLKHLSADEFAQLGAGNIVFLRKISGTELAEFLPDVAEHVDESELMLVMSADGNPVMVADSMDAVHEWLDDESVHLTALH